MGPIQSFAERADENLRCHLVAWGCLTFLEVSLGPVQCSTIPPWRVNTTIKHEYTASLLLMVLIILCRGRALVTGLHFFWIIGQSLRPRGRCQKIQEGTEVKNTFRSDIGGWGVGTLRSSSPAESFYFFPKKTTECIMYTITISHLFGCYYKVTFIFGSHTSFILSKKWIKFNRYPSFDFIIIIFGFTNSFLRQRL